MRLRLSPGPRTRLALMRWEPWVNLLSVALWLALCAVLVLVLIAERAERAKDETSTIWISALQVQSLNAEIVRPARDALDRALVPADPARIDWRQPAQAGVLVSVNDRSGFHVLSRPAALAPGVALEPRVSQQLGEPTRYPVPVGDLFCLPLPRADVARIRAALALPRAADVLAAACFDTHAVERAARATLPADTELTFWRGGQGLLRITTYRDALEVTREVEVLDPAVQDAARDASDLTTPEGALEQLVHGGRTMGSLTTREELRPMGRYVVNYIRRLSGDGTQGWTGISVGTQEAMPASPSGWRWALFGALAFLACVLLYTTYWGWRIAGRLTRRVRRVRGSAPARDEVMQASGG